MTTTANPHDGFFGPPYVARMVSVRGAADYAGVSDRTMWRLVLDGEIASIKVRRRRLIDMADLDGYLTRQRTAEGALGIEAAH